MTAAAEAAHVKWMEAKISQGFADHPLNLDRYHGQSTCFDCSLPPERHRRVATDTENAEVAR